MNAADQTQMSALAMLRWLWDAGADEAILAEPIDRLSTPEPDPRVRLFGPPAPPSATVTPITRVPGAAIREPMAAKPALVQRPTDAALSARDVAAKCQTLDALRDALAQFDGCSLKITAKSLVFSDGNPGAAVMFIGEAPGREEDQQGLPFVGRSGQLLDQMMAAIGLDRARVYIGNVIPWRPPGNRPPTAEEAAICVPFIARMIALAAPKVLVMLGGTPVKHLLGIEAGITRVRGQWHAYNGEGPPIAALATFHPAYLLRQPQLKKFAWADFLSLEDKLRGL